MGQAAASGLKQVKKLRFLLCILVMTLAILGSCLQPILTEWNKFHKFPPGFHLTVFLQSAASATPAALLPILAALPFSASYLNDLKTKFIDLFLIRSRYRNYLWGRLMVCWLTGAAVGLLAGLLARSVLLIMIFWEKGENFAAGADAETRCMMTCLLLALSGGFWSVTGMTLSTFFESRYIASAGPFVFYYMLVILCKRYLPDWVFLDPGQWLAPNELWPYKQWGPAILMAELTLLCSLLFYWKAGRRLRSI